MKLKHRCGVQAENARKGAPMMDCFAIARIVSRDRNCGRSPCEIFFFCYGSSDKLGDGCIECLSDMAALQYAE